MHIWLLQTVDFDIITFLTIFGLLLFQTCYYIEGVLSSCLTKQNVPLPQGMCYLNFSNEVRNSRGNGIGIAHTVGPLRNFKVVQLKLGEIICLKI